VAMTTKAVYSGLRRHQIRKIAWAGRNFVQHLDPIRFHTGALPAAG